MRDASIRAKVSETPPAIPQTTKIPTAKSAISFTTASSAMAVTTPWWRSFALRLRVPNRIAKTASPTATQRTVVVSFRLRKGSASAKIEKDRVIDCN